MPLRHSLWICFIAALMPASTLLVAAFGHDTEWVGGAAAIVFILVLAMAGLMITTVAGWGLLTVLIVHQLRLGDRTGRLLLVTSFAALFLLASVVPSGAGTAGGVDVPSRDILVGLTGLGGLLRENIWIGFGWVSAIAVASFAPPWLGLLAALVGVVVSGVTVADVSPPEARHRERPNEAALRKPFSVSGGLEVFARTPGHSLHAAGARRDL